MEKNAIDRHGVVFGAASPSSVGGCASIPGSASAPGVTRGVASRSCRRPSIHHATQLDNHPIYFTSPGYAALTLGFLCVTPGFCALRLCVCRAPGFAALRLIPLRCTRVTHGVASPRLPSPFVITSRCSSTISLFHLTQGGAALTLGFYVSPSGLLPLCGCVCRPRALRLRLCMSPSGLCRFAA